MNILKKNCMVFILIILLISLILNSVFNFTNIINENFSDFFEKASKGYVASSSSISADVSADVSDNEYDIKEDKDIVAIVSKYNGKKINVEPLGQPPTQKCIIKFFGSKSLTMNDDGSYSLGISNKDSVKQQWKFNLIKNEEDYKKIIPSKNLNLGYNLSNANYPFFVITSVYDDTKCLQYDNGSLLVLPTANYDSQKWDISYQKVISSVELHKTNPKSKLSGNFREDGGELSANEYLDDPNKIKLNLNLETNTLKQLLGTSGVNIRNNSSNNSLKLEDCDECKKDNWIPRASVKSICSGCDPDSLDPN